jgi:uncharacterized OB-fold protein
MRKLPHLSAETRPFWTGGSASELRIHRCDDCRLYFHPPAPVCRHCASRRVTPTPVSGRGRVLTFTVNHQVWTPELSEPFVVAIIELEEQAGLRFLSNVVNCDPEIIAIDMPVRVVFEQNEDVWIPLFEQAS